MRRIDLNGEGWKSDRDFYDTLATALGSPHWHGRNGDAFLETMVYMIDANTIQPPYEIVIGNAPEPLRPFLSDFASWLVQARQDRRNDPGWGDDVDVSVRLT